MSGAKRTFLVVDKRCATRHDRTCVAEPSYYKRRSGLGSGAFAQTNRSPSPPRRQPPQPKAATPQPSQPQVVVPDAEKIVLLLRSTLLTLNDAIQTGNFTVLRDRGAPGFRDANSAARLSQIFSDLASQAVDLSVVSVTSPQLTGPASIDEQKGMLHLKGYFPGQPMQINFEVLYQSVGGHRQLFGLSVNPSRAQPTAAQQ